MAAGRKKASRVLVEQVRGSNRSQQRMVQTLRSLGLGRIGKRCEHELTEPTLGMIRAVEHLVRVSPIE